MKSAIENFRDIYDDSGHELKKVRMEYARYTEAFICPLELYA
jgi:hypothetical protein